MKIRHRILLGFLSILTIFSILGLYVYFVWRQISQDVSALDTLFEFTAQHAISDIDAILHMELNLEQTSQALDQLSQGLPEVDDCLMQCFERFDANFVIIQTSIDEQMEFAASENNYEHLAHLESNLNAIEQLETEHKYLESHALEMMQLTRQGDLDDARSLYFQGIAPLMEVMLADLAVIETYIKAETNESITDFDNVLHEVDENISHIEGIVLTAYGGGIFFVILISLLISRAFAAPLAQLEKAAEAVEDESFEPDSLSIVTKRNDELGHLARVFVHMAQAILERVQKLKNQVLSLNIEIDRTKQKAQVAEITESDFFKDLENKAKEMRRKKRSS